ncbi:hypothetical protein E7744_04715 [Citricoccus sp. SGAir0253]|uniref:hypothetical protein n=1 Tax=Citricoccus sp. SGAir0253 TaxID=2567881 RepID=UPI0010CCCDC3|nr:hypothetical protein [Citricoccus sp. SGAir0253]QCU77600.1 hypothetical protein E7744_04715 [Citricoccus sp. SGAir0253]
MTVREAVSRWTISRCEPLVSDAYRSAASDELRRLSATEPQWFGLWAAGVLTDLVESLDPEDPWRNTSEADGVVVLPDGSPFGTWRNATDLLPVPVEADPALDVGLAALAEPLGLASTRAWLAARSGREAVVAELAAIDVGGAYPVAVPAIEWAMFRRRLFMGQEDAYIPQACIAWAARAEHIARAEAWDESGAARLRAGSRVEPGSWRLLA